MPIEVELPDGSIAEFPDGTSNSTMEMALSRYRQTKSGPNFGNVQTSSGSTEQARAPRQPAPKRTAAQLTGISDEMMNPAYQQPVGLGTKLLRTVMPLSDPNFRAGIGKSFADGYRGLKQLGTEAAMVQTGLTAGLMNRMGLDGNALVRNQGFPLQDARNQMMQDTADTRESDAPLMGTTAGLLGNATGTAAQFLGPGMALRGTTAARAFLPATIGGNAAQGAAMGAIQPYSSDGDRMANTALGGLAGAAGAGIPAALGAGFRAVTRPASSGVERRAGGLLNQALDGRQLNVEPSAVPGVQRTLGDASLDPGLMAMERNLRRTSPAGFTDIDLANNAARMQALQGIAGTESDMAAAMGAREAASGPLYAQAAGVQVTPSPELKAVLGRLPSGVMSKARQLARMEGVPFDDAQMTGQSLHYVKLALDDALGRVGPGSLGNTEKRIVMGVKENLLGEMSQALPTYGQGLDQSRTLSQPINRMQFGQEVIDRSVAAQADAMDNPLLQPGRYGRVMQDVDTIAQKATGFRGAKAKDIISSDDMKNLLAINEDLRRQSVRQSNPAQPGSATFEAGQLAGQVAKRGLLGTLGRGAPFVGDAITAYQQGMDQQLQQKLLYLYANPAEAQRVLSALKGRERSALESALIAIGGRTGVVGSTLTE